jgi:hypothetical protein
MSTEQPVAPSPEQWYHTSDGRFVPEPVPLAELRERFRDGRLKATDLVGRDGMAAWQTAASVADLLPVPWAVGIEAPARPPAAAVPGEPGGLRDHLTGLHDAGTLPPDDFYFLIGLLEGRLCTAGHGEGASIMLSPPKAEARGPGRLERKLARQSRRAHQTGGDEILDARPVAVADGDEVLDGIDLGFDFDDDGIGDAGAEWDEGAGGDLDADLDGDLDAGLDDLGDVGDPGGGLDLGGLGDD